MTSWNWLSYLDCFNNFPTYLPASIVDPLTIYSPLSNLGDPLKCKSTHVSLLFKTFYCFPCHSE